MRSQVVTRLGCLGLFIGMSSGSWAATVYTFTTFDVPGATDTIASGINDGGQIVGWGTYGFLKDGATFTRIDVPGATSALALGINDAGQIVGSAPNSFPHGFLKDGATITRSLFPAVSSHGPRGSMTRA